jgi:hypothetical protein
MTISLTEIIAALEAKANSTDSASSISDVLRLSIGSEAVSDGAIIYDSAGVLPTGTDWIGTIAATSDGTLYVYDQYDGWISSMQRSPFVYQGDAYGYSVGGRTSPTTNGRRIEKISFTSDANATNIGGNKFPVQRGNGAGASSRTTAYTIGYYTNSTSTIFKFPFASENDVVNTTGELLAASAYAAGTNNEFYGYKSGGRNHPGFPPSLNLIEKFNFSTEADTTDAGDLTRLVINPTGQSSETHGYSSGGQATSPEPNLSQTIIDKFPFAADANATDVGDILGYYLSACGQSSTTHGYLTGGTNPFYQNVIQKFSFSTDGNSTDVGDMTQVHAQSTGLSSTASGYRAGGSTGSSPAYYNSIDKFPFATDANGTDVGDLTTFQYSASGNQV